MERRKIHIITSDFDWKNPIVMVVDGAFTGVIGELVSIEMSLCRETINTIRVDYRNNIEVYSHQLIPIQHITKIFDIYGINILNSDGSFRNGYEIINELKERKIVIPKSYESYLSNLHITFVPRNDEVKIIDVNIIVPEKVVEVTFADGTKEKSVCREPDVFSLEQAISICISKKIMGGSGAYNNAVKRGMKVYDDKLKQEEADKTEQERIAKKRTKRLAYKERRAAERLRQEEEKKQLEREEKIEIQKEAYIRAMEYMQNQGA